MNHHPLLSSALLIIIIITTVVRFPVHSFSSTGRRIVNRIDFNGDEYNVDNRTTPVDNNKVVQYRKEDYDRIPERARFLLPIRKFFFGFNEFEGRGIKDFIGIVSTILAALLGAILVKLNALIVLSIISVGIGKLLLLITSFKLFHGLSLWKQSSSPAIIISDRIRSPYYPIRYYQEDDHHASEHFGRPDENSAYHHY